MNANRKYCEYVTNGKRNRLFLGQRIFLEMCFNSSQEPELWKAPDVKRHGCIVSITDSYLGYGNSSIFVCLDFPLHSSPSKIEEEFTKDLKIPGKHIVLLPVDKIGKLFNLKISNSYEPFPGSDMGVFCFECGNLTNRKNCIWVCKKRHFICCHHLFPWNADLNTPNWDAVVDHMNYFVNQSQKSKCFDTYTEVRALLSFQEIMTASSQRSKEVLLSEALTRSSFICRWCLEVENNKDYCIGINEIHSQLTPCPNINHAGTYPSSSHRVTDEIYDSLLNKGFSPSDIDRALDNMTASELQDVDVDYLSIIIQTTPRSNEKRINIITPVLEASGGFKETQNNSSRDRVYSVEGTVSFSPKLPHNMIVIARRPVTSQSCLVFIEEYSSYEDIINNIAESLQIPLHQRPSLRFYHISCDGWANEIRRGTSYESPNHSPLSPALPSSAAEAEAEAKSKVHESSDLYKDQKNKNTPDDFSKQHINSHQSASEAYDAKFLSMLDEIRHDKDSVNNLSQTSSPTSNNDISLSNNNIDLYFEFTNLKINSIIRVGGLRENIGPRAKLLVIAGAQRYNKPYLDKIKQLSKIYDGYREIRGDGNCYYRAVAFGILEYLIITGKGEKGGEFINLKNKFESLKYEDDNEQQDHEKLLDALQSASEGSIWRTVRELEEDILNTSIHNFDFALVRACRKIVSLYLIENQESLVHGISIKDAILSCSDCDNMTDYCEKYVLKMGEDAEGTFVNLGFLLTSLNCSGKIVYLDPRPEVPINVHNTEPIQQSLGFSFASMFYATPKPIATVYLLLRPGHYDLLYPNGLIPCIIEKDPSVQLSKIEKDEKKAYKVLDSPKQFELYQQIVSCGISAPFDQLLLWAERSNSLQEVIDHYFKSHYAQQIIEDSDPEGKSNSSFTISSPRRSSFSPRLSFSAKK